MSKTNVDRARELLHIAADASKKLEESVRELVTMRAWDVLGFENFCCMWQEVNGFPAPSVVKVLAVQTLAAEGMSTNNMRPNGHLTADVGRLVGLSVSSCGPGGRGQASGPVIRILKQLNAGVPVELVVINSDARGREVIEKHGTRSRATPRRIGKALDELVGESVNVIRRDADEVAEIARQAGVPKAEIYRQAVAEYLARHRESRPAPLDFTEVAS